MKSSKSQILEAIRNQRLAPVELPDLTGAWTTYDDPKQQFADVLEGVGGKCRVVRDSEEINRSLADISEYSSANRVCSLVDGVGQSNVALDEIDTPHALQDVDFAIIPGEFAVAENGAVWVTDAQMKHRAILFIAQHVALVVPADQVVHNMPQAYERLSFETPRFGCFVSGPSKTADIEQSLVIGAQGPRSLAVFLVEQTV